MDLLLVTDGDKSYYVYIKDFERFMFYKTKNENKKYFCKSCLQCFISKNALTEHKEICLNINGAQYLRLEKETIDFKKYFKQIPVLFKIYADFECNLRVLKVMKVFTQKNIKITLPAVLLTNLFVLMINLPGQQLFLEVKTLLLNLLKQFLKSLNTVKK